MNNDIDRYNAILDDMRKTYIAKNSDYGDSCHKTFEEFGLTSFLVRLSDKLNRAISLSKKDDSLVKDESLRDTLQDMANYAVLACLELDKAMQTPSKNIPPKIGVRKAI